MIGDFEMSQLCKLTCLVYNPSYYTVSKIVVFSLALCSLPLSSLACPAEHFLDVACPVQDLVAKLDGDEVAVLAPVPQG